MNAEKGQRRIEKKNDTVFNSCDGNPDNEVSASLTGTLDLTQRASADKDMAGEQLKQSPSCQHRQGEMPTPSTSTRINMYFKA